MYCSCSVQERDASCAEEDCVEGLHNCHREKREKAHELLLKALTFLCCTGLR